MDSEKRLSRSLTLFPTTCLVLGSVVGSGIFISSAQMARDLKSASLMLLVWAFTGLMTLFGAFTQCELLGQMPATGGLYLYLRKIYGEKIGFLFGWASFMIAGSGGIAALAFIFANFTGEFILLPHLSPALEKWEFVIPFVGSIFPLADLGAKAVGVTLIVFLTILNIRGVRLGALVQSVSMVAKALAILGIIIAALLLSKHHVPLTPTKPFELHGLALWGAVIASMSSAFWAYDGWGNVAFIAGEVQNPTKTLPRAIILGTLGFIALYLLINLAYIFILPIELIGHAPQDRVASSMMMATVGPKGVVFVALLILLSTFDTANSGVLTSARVYFAMAQDGIFAKSAARVHSRFQTPYWALIYQGVWSVFLLLSGSFELIFSMYVFVNWLLYILQGLGVFVLRRRFPQAERPYQTPGYPWVPIVFVVFSTLFVTLTLVNDIAEFRAGTQPIIKSVMGLILVISGLPLYYYWKRAYSAKSVDLHVFQEKGEVLGAPTRNIAAE